MKNKTKFFFNWNTYNFPTNNLKRNNAPKVIGNVISSFNDSDTLSCQKEKNFITIFVKVEMNENTNKNKYKPKITTRIKKFNTNGK